MKKVLAFLAVAVFLVTVRLHGHGPGRRSLHQREEPGGFTTRRDHEPRWRCDQRRGLRAELPRNDRDGDWSVDAALSRGRRRQTLKNVAVDHPSMNILGLYGKFCTTVAAQVAQ